MAGNPFKNLPPDTSPLTDAEVVAGIRAGRAALQDVLYQRYAFKIYRKCRTMVRDKDLALDLTHDIFLKVTTKLEQFKGASDLSFWIYSITYNHCISYLKKAKRLRFDPIEGSVEPEDEGRRRRTEKIIHDLELDQLERLLGSLPPDDVVLLQLRYREGRSVKQVAELLGLGESAVKMRLQRSRNRLAKSFRRVEREEE